MQILLKKNYRKPETYIIEEKDTESISVFEPMTKLTRTIANNRMDSFKLRNQRYKNTDKT